MEARLFRSPRQPSRTGIGARLLPLLVALTGAACGAQRGAATSSDTDDPEPILTADQKAALAQLSPETLPAPPRDASNRWADDPTAAAFGQALFFDPSFSGKLLDGDNDGSVHALGRKGETGKVACVGCHLPESGYSDTRTIRRQISLAAGWGRRRSPSLLDVGQSTLLMWDGRHDTLHGQFIGVVESPVEMNSSRLFAAHQLFLRHKATYEAIFGEMPPLDDPSRFPPLDAELTGCQKLNAQNTCPEPMRGAPGDGAEFDGMAPEDQEAVTRVVVNAGKAVGAYLRLLSCGASRFDYWMRGDTTALNRAEQRGAALFVGKADCASCHSGPHLSDEKFHNVGLRAQRVATAFLNAHDRGAAEGLPLALSDPLNVQGTFSDGDDGRLSLEVSPGLEGAFRTPRLRCVSQRPSFMHTGQMDSLEMVVAFFGRGGEKAGYPGTNELTPLDLTARERADLVSFLRALDGTGPSQDLREAP